MYEHLHATLQNRPVHQLRLESSTWEGGKNAETVAPSTHYALRALFTIAAPFHFLFEERVSRFKHAFHALIRPLGVLLALALAPPSNPPDQIAGILESAGYYLLPNILTNTLGCQGCSSSR
jgi:hypothetical protein